MGRGKRHGASATLRPVASGLIRISEKPDLLLGVDDPTPGMEATTGLGAASAITALDPAVLRAKLAGGVIVDLDDTLNVNHCLFLRSRAHLTEIFTELDPDTDPYVLALSHRDSSNALIPVYGFTPTRWRVGALEAAAGFAGRDLTAAEEARILAAAEVGVGIGELYPGVEETLAALKRAEVPMVLLTKGEEDKQREKIAGHGLERFFDSIRITDHKDAALLQEVASEHGFTDPVVIGDSEKSDILPATEAGFDSVLVDRGAPKWVMERHENEIDTAKATGFPEAIALLAGV
jgi:FMN phosphatase YigB (HAD superfamily)